MHYSLIGVMPCPEKSRLAQGHPRQSRVHARTRWLLARCRRVPTPCSVLVTVMVKQTHDAHSHETRLKMSKW